MKCTICGCEDLFKVPIINNQVLATEGYVAQTVNSFAYMKCGHVELFVEQKTIDDHIAEIEKKFLDKKQATIECRN